MASSPPWRRMPPALRFALAVVLMVLVGTVAWFVGFGLVAVVAELVEAIR